MGKDKPGSGKGFAQAAALILHGSNLAISPEETSPEGRLLIEHLAKGNRLIESFPGEESRGGIRAVFIRPRKGGILELRVETQDGRQFSAITTQDYTVRLRDEHTDDTERTE